ncbi:VRR-NUC domain-containing protein [Pseudomonas fluorescens]|uniref:phosphodiesterase I n=1 Tax=Pseudomonas fluorescens TaxID=294 RepID=A0A944HC65_PSEFL|nr:VRR-NUC domain-containing protein [Pseudomonas fluorescens]MBT2298415.1 VRR-NUC domain-containing protein [Pseudomonas fluorescens]MBT2309941.1 VRR-NUC domain-containing protein [Pseudomonas fluorescens]MBT2310964.1 VRR-NUC domain-containing protein [Pseudomonas fluorescens]MBT2320101.1 VRR-NUC domain-containing protein [Pseudomonas fluorescens]MBT2328871.1 VRR-NUC domain-containing protein [Pseudomonas fluorescens]
MALLSVTNNPLDDPFYYLNNFEQVLVWLATRYADVLSVEEQRFIDDFACLPRASQGLLVRMVMRKGRHFRHSKLQYPEIGDIGRAVEPLLALGWVEDQVPLSLVELFEVLLKQEIIQCLGHLIEHPKATKGQWLESLQGHFDQPQPLRIWCPLLEDRLFSLTIMNLCDRLRLLFFGNLYQDWSEFVLADLGIFTYETVEFSAQSRGLRSRQDVDACLFLHECQQRFEAGEPLEEIVAQVHALSLDNPWLERRRGKLLFQVGQHAERSGDFTLALRIYQDCSYPGARLRMIRVMERIGEYAQALEWAQAAAQAPQSAAETQALLRILPRLRRKLGGPAVPRTMARKVERLDLQLPRVDPALSVEYHVQAHLHDETAPVHYVENSLINSLFGLLCWPVIFAPLPGAFFHPFQRGPVDLLNEDFHERRAELFAACFAQLDDGRYRDTIVRRYTEKWGVQSPFVFWGALSEELLHQALDCLPAEHLKHWFSRLLLDIKANRAGMPDLIQFWPQHKTYRMIEVKGPGDRLQDNQLRWLEFCHEHQMPVAVCYVQWAEQGA